MTKQSECGIISIESEVRETEQERYVSKRKAPSKKDRATMILNTIAKWQREGMTNEQAVERLTLAQYDFMIEYGINLDTLIMTEQQQKAATAITRAPRPKDLSYNKKYPQNKQDLYTDLENFIREQGATIQQREKANYRDLDFEIDGTAYKIVLSNPRTKK